jgi:hypothetical protein
MVTKSIETNPILLRSKFFTVNEAAEYLRVSVSATIGKAKENLREGSMVRDCCLLLMSLIVLVNLILNLFLQKSLLYSPFDPLRVHL